MATFPRQCRLLNATQFTTVLKSPTIRFNAGPLRIRARENRIGHPRLGLVVTKKGNPTAVRRNRIKRLIRENFRRHLDQLPSTDLVVQVVGDVDDDRLNRQMMKGFRQLSQEQILSS